MLEDSKVGKKFSGIFRGQVISHLPCGRCKIWIPDVYPYEWATEESSDLKDVYGESLRGTKLPDAEQASPLFGGAKSGNGSFSYPKIGSYVWCMFERDDIQHPIYFAAAIDTTDLGEGNSFAQTTVDSDNGTVLKHMIKCGPSKITFNEDGTVTIGNDTTASIVFGPGNQITLNAEKMSINGINISIGTENTKSIDLLSEQNITMTAGNLLDQRAKIFILSTDYSCTIHDKQFNRK